MSGAPSIVIWSIHCKGPFIRLSYHVKELHGLFNLNLSEVICGGRCLLTLLFHQSEFSGSLKPASCSTLGLKESIVSLKYLFAYIVSAQGLRFSCRETSWKPCKGFWIMLCSSILLNVQWETQHLGLNMLPRVIRMRRKESQYSYWTQGKRCP